MVGMKRVNKFFIRIRNRVQRLRRQVNKMVEENNNSEQTEEKKQKQKQKKKGKEQKIQFPQYFQKSQASQTKTLTEPI